jgi:hypothetical protein
VAISNHRLDAVADGRVSFRYQDYADDRRCKAMTLAAEEFLRRFLQHVLPSGFVKVRHYGLLANRRRAERLAVCRALLGVGPAAALPSSQRAAPAASIGPAIGPTCPQCGGTHFARTPLPPAATDPDTS